MQPNTLHKRHWTAFTALILFTLMLTGCAAAKQVTERVAPGAAQAAPTVNVPNATPTPIVVSTPSAKTGDKAPEKLFGGANLTYNGEIMADRIIPVVAEVAGQVVKVAVDAGSKVKTGDLLVKIDSSIPEAQRAQAMAGLEAAQSQLDLATDEAHRDRPRSRQIGRGRRRGRLQPGAEGRNRRRQAHGVRPVSAG